MGNMPAQGTAGMLAVGLCTDRMNQMRGSGKQRPVAGRIYCWPPPDASDFHTGCQPGSAVRRKRSQLCVRRIAGERLGQMVVTGKGEDLMTLAGEIVEQGGGRACSVVIEVDEDVVGDQRQRNGASTIGTGQRQAHR